MRTKFMIVLFKWLAHAIRATKLVYFRTIYVCLHINFYTHIHYPNQHDLLNWTLAYSTIEIGHRTLDPPASNRKSVLIPIILKGKSTLLIIRKCRHDAVYELFFCAFKDRNTLNMRSLPCFNHTSLINANILRFVATIGHEFLL